jgi:hypothetical protein
MEDPTHVDELHCECGREKAEGATACAQCEYMDGTLPGDIALIQALRSLGGAAAPDAVQLEMGCKYRQYRRVANRLERSGRIRRVETGEEHHKNVPLIVLAGAG